MTDLADCAREPIHTPGTIQPFGVLLVLTEPSLRVAQVSDNVGEFLARETQAVLGQPLATVIDPASVGQVRAALCEERWHEVNPLSIVANGRQLDGIVHRHAGAAILELEPNPGPPLPTRHAFRSALLQIQHVSTMPQLADVVVEQMRRVTGFERVMLYRFHEDGHGSVDAEARDAAREPYLGQHYPASDIPGQARQLYLKSWLRLIFDAHAAPARLVPALRVDTGEPLDLTFSVLRSVSPIHLEYMKNMGVRASMSVSLIVRDRLWGLISCLNHTSPMRVSQDIRAACEFLGRLTSLQIAAIEDRELLALRASRRATEAALADTMHASGAEDSVLEALLTQAKELMGLVGAAGAAVVGMGGPLTCGLTPRPALIQDIAAWVDEREASAPFCTASLSAMLPEAREAGDVASGLLTFALPGAPRRRLLWFRPEVIQTVSWGGDPSKPVAPDPGDRLRPRHSFALWREEVRLRSHPWAASDLEAAAELQRRALEVDLERRLAGERRAVRARDELLAIVSHDLRAPLAGILLQTEVMLRGGRKSDEARSRLLAASALQIRRSATRMKTLTDDLLDAASIEARRFAVQPRPVQIQDLVDEALLAASPLAEAKSIALATELVDAPSLDADPERLLRVFSNLLGNAIKFTPNGGAIKVHVERHGAELWLTVADTGPGIDADRLPHVFDRYWKAGPASRTGAGLGLYIAKGVIEAHGGRIWAESSPGGARVGFALPLADGVDRGLHSDERPERAPSVPWHDEPEGNRHPGTSR